MHSLTWEEAQIAAGVDPDFHRRDLYDAIENGAFPEWELGIQVFPDTQEETFEGIDLLDPTKLVPEELAPVQPIGTLVLTGNPTNFFAETEQVAFHTGHLVPGIEGTNDPLLQGRNFSYLDTQLTRLGGPNFTQIPINRPHAPVNDNPRDGFHQQAVHDRAGARTRPTASTTAPRSRRLGRRAATCNVPAAGRGRRRPARRRRPSTTTSRRRRCSTPASPSVEQQHVIDAYTFELGKVYEQAIKERALDRARQDRRRTCARRSPPGSGCPRRRRTRSSTSRRSPALAQISRHALPDRRPRSSASWPGRAPTSPGSPTLRKALEAEGALLRVIAPHGGQLVKGKNVEIVERTFATGRSIEFDAIVVADGAPKDGDFRAVVLLQEAFRHLKAVGAWGDGVEVLAAAGIDPEAPGVLTGTTAGAKLAAGLDRRAGPAPGLGPRRRWWRRRMVPPSV